MADVFLIVANKRNFKENGVKYFPDCVTEINHDMRNEVSEYPVEDGETISDHVQKRNRTFSFSAQYSPYNLNVWVDDKIAQDPQSRVQEAYRALIGLRDNRTVFTFVSKYDSYPNCVITNLSIPVTPDQGNSLRFSAEITQLRIATTEQVNIIQTQNVIESKKDDASVSSSSGKAKTFNSITENLRIEASETVDFISMTEEEQKRALNIVSGGGG